MTKQELIDKCQTMIDDLTIEIENPPGAFSYYNEFCRMYNYKKLEGIFKIPFIDYAAILYYPYVKNKNIGEIITDMRSIVKIMEVLNYKELKDVNEILTPFVEANKIEILEDIFNDTNKRRMSIRIKEVLDDKNRSAEDRLILAKANTTIEKLIENANDKDFNVLKLIEYYKSSRKMSSNILYIERTYKELKEKKLDINSREVKEKYNLNGILELFSMITTYRKEINDDKRAQESRLKDSLNKYKKFLRNIEAAFKKDEIRNYEMIIQDMDDEELIKEFLYLVYQHNMLKYDEIDSLHSEYTKNSLINYLTILNDNNIKKDEVDINKVMNNSCEDLEKMLKVLTSIVTDKKSIIKIIENSNYDNVNYFKELKSKNVLSTKAFNKYPEIFNENSSLRKQLDENIKVINEYKVDFTNFSKKPEILIENSNLNTNLEILKNYELIDKLDGLNKYNFLTREDLIKTLDIIIELGYERLLVDDLELLNENNWDRIYVLKSMGLLPETKEELIKYLRDDKFFIPKNKINSYIENVSKYYGDLGVSYEINIDEFVREKEVSPRVLSFDGVLISKNRVLNKIDDRNVNINELFKAIINDSILSMDEIENIKKELKVKINKIGE